MEICLFSYFNWVQCSWSLSLLLKGRKQISRCLCQHSFTGLTFQRGHSMSKVLRGFYNLSMLNWRAFKKYIANNFFCPPKSQNQLCYLKVRIYYRVILLTFEALCKSPGSSLKYFKGWTPNALPAETRASEWHGKGFFSFVFLTPKVFLCTDCHFKGWGYPKSLSWCLALLLGDTECFLG